MKTLSSILLAVLLFTGCAEMPTANCMSKRAIKARITYYTAHEDKWGSRVACSSSFRAKEGRTVAAHPDFPFYRKITIPGLKGIVGDGSFCVEDRGRDVTRKKASRGNAYVFDVFVGGKHSRLRSIQKRVSDYMEVYLE